jgi:hypothetical protein
VNTRGSAGSPMGAARRAGNSDTLENLARVGLIAYGVVHLLVAWISLQLAWGGGGGGSADQSGAMATLARQPLGKPLLWIAGLGLIGLALWQAAEVLRYRGDWSGSAGSKQQKKALGKSGKALVKAVVYVGLAVLAITFATGSSRSSSRQQEKTTAGVLSWPGGRWLIGIAGLVLIGVGVYHVVKGVTKRFLDQIDLSQASAGTRTVITRVGQVGFPGKGVALGVVGGLLDYAALTFDPQKASGLDGAMRTLLQAPFGQALLTLVAAGIAAYGVFCLARARYPERT